MQPLVGDLVLTWDSVAGWPTVGDFPIRIDHPSNGTFEYVLCTSVNVGALQTTVTRAQESTSASGGFIVGSTGANALTKATMDAAFVRLDTALSQTLTGPLVVPTALGGSAAPTSYGSMPIKAAETLLIATAATISYTSIPATFRNAILDWYARTDRASTSDPVILKLNNAGTYDYESTNSSGTGAPTSAEALTQAGVQIGTAAAATATAAYFGQGVARVNNYAGTTGNKLVTSHSTVAWADTTGTLSNQTFAGKLRTTAAAVNRFDLTPGVGANFIIGCLFTLWLEP